MNDLNPTVAYWINTVAILVLLALAGLILRRLLQLKRYCKGERILQLRNLKQTKFVAGWGVVTIVSIDGGISWYLADTASHRSLAIKRPAPEAVLKGFPGVLELQRHAQLRGYPGDDYVVTETDVALMKAASFAIADEP